jgi:biotin carboxylase
MAIYVGKPAKWPGWGYAVKRKNVAAKTLAQAGVFVTQFEKGELTMDELLDKLDVGYVMQEAGVAQKSGKKDVFVKMIPFARVVLKRSSGTDAWAQTKTHFPDDRLSAEGWEIEGKDVRKGPTGAVEQARY